MEPVTQAVLAVCVLAVCVAAGVSVRGAREGVDQLTKIHARIGGSSFMLSCTVYTVVTAVVLYGLQLLSVNPNMVAVFLAATATAALMGFCTAGLARFDSLWRNISN